MDFNRINKEDYGPNDLFDPQINARIAHWYMNTRIPSLFKGIGIADTVEHRLWAYNAGLGALKRGIKPKETRLYIAKYHKGGV
jgi:soluble lytic murein transglycosylase-like protein